MMNKYAINEFNIAPTKEINIDIIKNALNTKNNLNFFITKMQLFKIMEQNNSFQINKRLFPKIDSDNKTHLLLKKTYCMNILSSIENHLENDLRKKKGNSNISRDEYFALFTDLYKLSNLDGLFICQEDFIKCLNIQNKIINILKQYVDNELNVNSDCSNEINRINFINTNNIK